MRPLELIAIILPAIAALHEIVRNRWLSIRLGAGSAVLAPVAAVAQIALEGARAEILPAYAAGAVCVAIHFLASRISRRQRALVAFGSLVLVGAAGVGCITHPVFRLPAPQGPFPVGTSVLSVGLPHPVALAESDVPSVASIAVQIWYPASPGGNFKRAPYEVGRRPHGIRQWLSRGRLIRTDSKIDADLAGDGPYPLLVYFPSWGGIRSENSNLAQDLASHGFIVISVDDLFPDDPMDFSSQTAFQRTLLLADRKVRAMAEAGLGLLASIRRSPSDSPVARFADRIDWQRVSAFGFSFGGAIAAEVALFDPQIKSVVNLDGWVFGDAARQWIQQPYLIVSTFETPPAMPATARPPDESFYTAQLDQQVDREVDAGHKKFGGYFLTVDRTMHYSFSDLALFLSRDWTVSSTGLSVDRANRIIHAFTLEFFDSVLNHRPSQLFGHSNEFDPAAHLQIFEPERVASPAAANGQ